MEDQLSFVFKMDYWDIFKNLKRKEKIEKIYDLCTRS